MGPETVALNHHLDSFNIELADKNVFNQRLYEQK